MTPAEQCVWRLVRGDGLGCACRRIHVIDGWLVDFYVPAARLVLEVDGDVHDLQAEEDAARTAALEALGLRVVRVRNEQVLADAEAVATWLRAEVSRRLGRTAG